MVSLLLLPLLAAGQSLVIVHTNDTHSHIEPLRTGFGPEEGMGGEIGRAHV